jgi:site-specific recombinase XerD
VQPEHLLRAGLTVADLVNDLLVHPPADWKSPITVINRKNYAARINAALGKVKVARLRGLSIVFGDGAGAPKWPQDVRRDFQKLCGRAGIGSTWVPREQRHTFVSVLSDSGVDIEKIADAVGHVNSTVTKAVYRHQIADEITSAATVMDSIFGEASSS